MRDGLGPGTGLLGIKGEINVDTILTGSSKLYFRDSGISISSTADGKLVISSDGNADDAIQLNGPCSVVVGDKTGSEGLTVISAPSVFTPSGFPTSRRRNFILEFPSGRHKARWPLQGLAGRNYAEDR